MLTISFTDSPNIFPSPDADHILHRLTYPIYSCLPMLTIYPIFGVCPVSCTYVPCTRLSVCLVLFPSHGLRLGWWVRFPQTTTLRICRKWNICATCMTISCLLMLTIFFTDSPNIFPSPNADHILHRLTYPIYSCLPMLTIYPIFGVCPVSCTYVPCTRLSVCLVLFPSHGLRLGWWVRFPQTTTLRICRKWNICATCMTISCLLMLTVSFTDSPNQYISVSQC